MLINITALKDLYLNLNDEFIECKKRGKRNSQIKVRIDCVLLALQNISGSAIVANPQDEIVDV